MKAFEQFMIWFLTIVVAILVCETVHLRYELKEAEQKIDNLNTAVSILSLLKGSSYVEPQNDTSIYQNDGSVSL